MTAEWFDDAALHRTTNATRQQLYPGSMYAETLSCRGLCEMLLPKVMR